MVFLPFAPLPPELRADVLMHNRCYLVAAPDHPLSAQSILHLEQLSGQQVYYEPIYRTIVQFLQQQLSLPPSTGQRLKATKRSTATCSPDTAFF